MTLTVRNAREVQGLLQHGSWPPETRAKAEADLAAYGYVFVTGDHEYVPHPTPPFVPEDYPIRVMAWVKEQG